MLNTNVLFKKCKNELNKLYNICEVDSMCIDSEFKDIENFYNGLKLILECSEDFGEDYDRLDEIAYLLRWSVENKYNIIRFEIYELKMQEMIKDRLNKFNL